MYADIACPFILKTFPVPAVSYVLLVKVSVVSRPTNVSLTVGNVNVPLLTMLLKLGVVNEGLVPNTNAPLPVSSLITPANCAEVVAANTLKLLLV